MRKLSLSLCALVALFAFAACGAWSETQRQGTREFVMALAEQEGWSSEKLAEVLAVIDDLADGTDWSEVLAWLLGLGVAGAGLYRKSIGAAVAKVNAERGPPKPMTPETVDKLKSLAANTPA